MAQECMSIFERDKLPLVAGVEQVHFSNRKRCHDCATDCVFLQSCATGFTAEGKTPKTLVEEMVPLLDSREVM
jgi:syntaxin-binding protein 1